MIAPRPSSSPVREASSLRAALAALTATALIFGAVHLVAFAQVRSHIERFNVDDQFDKLLGTAIQTEVFRNPSLLPVYGSSELTEPQTNRADAVFRSHPTGFGAFLIGYPSETSLMIAMKLAALDPAEASGKKAVVFLSPAWFLSPELDHLGFGVNFSPLHGAIFAFESRLSDALKADIARRLLEYPETVSQNPLLHTALICLRDGTTADRALFAVLAPIGKSENLVQRQLDGIESGWWSWKHRRDDPEPPGPPAGRGPLAIELSGHGAVDWKQHFHDTEAALARLPPLSSYSTAAPNKVDGHGRKQFRNVKHPEIAPDKYFADNCAASKEWNDFALLLRTAREMKIRLMIICQPLNTRYGTLQGLSTQSPALYDARLRESVAPYDVQLATYTEFENDPHFFCDCIHPSGKAWIAYDSALDHFFHWGTVPDRLR